MIKYLFGLPTYRTSLLNERYNKEDLIKVVLKNYDKDKNRNNWDKNSLECSKIHHFLNDESNLFFDTPNFNPLLPIYKKHITNFLNNLKLKKNFNFNFKIVNYSCMTEGQHMKSHIHTDCDFSAIHYLKFDESFNDSTLFYNSNSYSKYLNVLRPGILNYFNNEDEKNSWIFYNYKFNTKEDDLIIFPSVLDHGVPVVESKKHRITISINISLESL
jgi:uncharacterized protein (TIGR02466 family)